jgi:DNA-binding response OmpR family regulator
VHFHIKDWHHGEEHGRVAGEGQGRIQDILTDAVQRGYDGFAVLEAVRGDPTLAGTRILMLTAKGREAEQNKGLALGADVYMPKPFSTRDLVDKVKELLALTG